MPSSTSSSVITPVSSLSITKWLEPSWAASERPASSASSQSFRSREEAEDAGRSLAQQLGSRHVVVESEESGVITDEEVDDGT